jgi:hypothetical protein
MVDFPSLGRVEVIPITCIRLPLRVIESMASLISGSDSVNGDGGVSVMVQIGLSIRTMFCDLGSVDVGLDKARLEERSPSGDWDAMPFRVKMTGLALRFVGSL